jgi:hypothetical protein
MILHDSPIMRSEPMLPRSVSDVNVRLQTRCTIGLLRNGGTENSELAIKWLDLNRPIPLDGFAISSMISLTEVSFMALEPKNQTLQPELAGAVMEGPCR